MSEGVPLFLTAPGALAVPLAASFRLAPRRRSYPPEGGALVVTRLTDGTAPPHPESTARRSAGRLGSRLYGTALPGDLTGLSSFGPDAPSRVQAAASRGSDGVIVEHGSTTYFLTPADPGALLRARTARGVRVAA